MARVAGVNIPDRKHTVIALTEIYGIGNKRAEIICDSAGIDKTILVKNLSESDINIINKMINKLTIKEITDLICQNSKVSKKLVYKILLDLKKLFKSGLIRTITMRSYFFLLGL